MAKSNETTGTDTAAKAAVYSKRQFLQSTSFEYSRDLIHAVLADDTKYSKADAKAAIEQYLNKNMKEVK